jgi:hypothetical protein
MASWESEACELLSVTCGIILHRFGWGVDRREKPSFCSVPKGSRLFSEDICVLFQGRENSPSWKNRTGLHTTPESAGEAVWVSTHDSLAARGAGTGPETLPTRDPSLQEKKFLRMLAEAGVPELVRCEISSELLQPLVPRYEEALSQLERTVKVRTTKLRVRVLQIKPQEL